MEMFCLGCHINVNTQENVVAYQSAKPYKINFKKVSNNISSAGYQDPI